MSGPAATRRIGLALAASLLLHAVVVLYLRGVKPRPVVAPPRAVELEIIRSAPLPQAPPAAPQAAAPPAPSAKTVPSRPRAVPVAPPAVAPEDAPVAPPADSPLAAAAPRLAPSLTLLPGSASSDVVVKEAPPAESGPGTSLHAPRVAKDLVKELVAESVGRGKVDRGLVDPYFADLGKALLKVWDPDRAVSRKGLKGFGEQFVENNQMFQRIWAERAAQFAKTGSPLPEGTDIPRDVPYGPDPNRADKQAMRRYAMEQWKSARRALIRVTQDRQGKLVSVELVAPSNDPTVDKEGMADVRAAAEQLPPPPAEAVGAKPQLVSLWQFELIISISPPIPSFTFEFDEALKFIDARMPLDRRLYKRVRLISVE